MSSTQAQHEAKQILVVDDNEDNLFLLEALLTEEGYEVELAKNGKSALAKIEDILPDLVLLDMMMPGMNGYEVTQRIRQNQKLPFIPILILTAYRDANVPQGLDLGANDFIRKPIDYLELLARVRAFLRLKSAINP